MLREKCIRKALFHLFTRTKAHWKQIDPEGSTRVLSCIKIFLLKSLAVGEAMRLWSVCQAVKSSIQKPGADNFAAVFFWPALLSMTGWVWVTIFWWGLRIFRRCISWECLLHESTVRCFWSLPVPLPWPWEPTMPVGFWQGSLWVPWAARDTTVVQLIHSSAQLQKLESQLSLGSLPLLLFLSIIVEAGYFCILKGLSQKSWETWLNYQFFRAKWVSSKPLFAHLPREVFSRLLWKPSRGALSSWKWKVSSLGAFGFSLAVCALSCWALWKGHSAGSMGKRSGSLLSFGLGFCKSLWAETWRTDQCACSQWCYCCLRLKEFGKMS